MKYRSEEFGGIAEGMGRSNGELAKSGIMEAKGSQLLGWSGAWIIWGTRSAMLLRSSEVSTENGI